MEEQSQWPFASSLGGPYEYFTQQTSLVVEPNLKKRLRAGVACETCRQKHRRCDGMQPICSPCMNRSAECLWEGGAGGAHTHHHPPTPNPSSSKRPKPNEVSKTTSTMSPRTPLSPSSTDSQVSTPTGHSDPLVSAYPLKGEVFMHNLSFAYNLVTLYIENVYPTVGIPAPSISTLSHMSTMESTPLLDKQRMLMYSILATGSRSCGDIALSGIFHQRSRSLLINYFDEVDPYVALTHALNAYYLTHVEFNDRARLGVALAQEGLEALVERLTIEERRPKSVMAPQSTTLPLWSTKDAIVSQQSLLDQVLPVYSFISSGQVFRGLKVDHADECTKLAAQLATRCDSISMFNYTISQMIVAITSSMTNPGDAIAKLEGAFQAAPAIIRANKVLMDKLKLVNMLCMQAYYAYEGRVEEAVALDDSIFNIVKSAKPTAIDIVLLSSLFISAQVCSRFSPERFQGHIEFYESCAPTLPIAKEMVIWLSKMDAYVARYRPGSPTADRATLISLPYFPIWSTEVSAVISALEEHSHDELAARSPLVPHAGAHSRSPTPPISPSYFYHVDWLADSQTNPRSDPTEFETVVYPSSSIL